MAQIISQRMAADAGGPFVVFMIGMRVNKLWKVHKWLPVARAMSRMVKEVSAHPETGFLGVQSWGGNPSIMVQYWRSFEDLERYAKNRDAEHLPAWAAFNKVVGSNGDVGIWHETYRVDPGDYECVYNNMPAFGLAAFTKMVPASGQRESARGRLDTRES